MKKNYYSYTINNYSLEKIYNIVNLGVKIDQKLNFVLHINNVVLQAKNLFAFVKKIV